MRIHVSFPDIMNTVLIHKVSFDVVEPEYRLETRHHNIFEILHCYEGEITEWLGEREILFKTGDWLFIDSGVRHRTWNHSGRPFAFLAIHFDIDDPEIRRSLKSFPPEACYFAHETVQGSRLGEHLKQLESILYESLINDGDAGDLLDSAMPATRKISFQAYVLLVVHEFLKLRQEGFGKPERPVAAPSGVDVELAHAVAKFMEQRFSEAAAVQSIAKRLNVSRSHCTRVFKKVYGVPPRRYLSELKLRKSKELLLHTNLAVDEIAERLGFSSPYHFSKQFHRWTGISPTRFRPKHTSAHRNEYES